MFATVQLVELDRLNQQMRLSRDSTPPSPQPTEWHRRVATSTQTRNSIFVLSRPLSAGGRDWWSHLIQRAAFHPATGLSPRVTHSLSGRQGRLWNQFRMTGCSQTSHSVARFRCTEVLELIVNRIVTHALPLVLTHKHKSWKVIIKDGKYTSGYHKSYVHPHPPTTKVFNRCRTRQLNVPEVEKSQVSS